MHHLWDAWQCFSKWANSEEPRALITWQFARQYGLTDECKFLRVPYYHRIDDVREPLMEASPVFTSRMHLLKAFANYNQHWKECQGRDAWRSMYDEVQGRRKLMAKCSKCREWKYGLLVDNFKGCTSSTRPTENRHHRWQYRELFCNECWPHLEWPPGCKITTAWRTRMQATHDEYTHDRSRLLDLARR